MEHEGEEEEELTCLPAYLFIRSSSGALVTADVRPINLPMNTATGPTATDDK